MRVLQMGGSLTVDTRALQAVCKLKGVPRFSDLTHGGISQIFAHFVRFLTGLPRFSVYGPRGKTFFCALRKSPEIFRPVDSLFKSEHNQYALNFKFGKSGMNVGAKSGKIQIR